MRRRGFDDFYERYPSRRDRDRLRDFRRDRFYRPIDRFERDAFLDGIRRDRSRNRRDDERYGEPYLSSPRRSHLFHNSPPNNHSNESTPNRGARHIPSLMDEDISKPSRHKADRSPRENKIDFGEPSNTIMMRGLPLNVEEAEIREEFLTLGLSITDLRLVRRKDTGTSRGFGFIEFSSVEDAKKFLETTKGYYLLMNEYPITLLYSIPRWEDDSKLKKGTNDTTRDWECIRCGIRNFKRREVCFKCSLPKEESEKVRDLDGFENTGTIPCNTLVLRGLDSSVTGEVIIRRIKETTGLEVKNVHVARNPLTNDSRGFAFIELSSVHEATAALEKLQNRQPPFEINRKAILVNFSKTGFAASVAEINSITSSKDGGEAMSGALGTQQDFIMDLPPVALAQPLPESQADQANVAAAVAQAAMKNLHNTKKPVVAVAAAAAVIKAEEYSAVTSSSCTSSASTSSSSASTSSSLSAVRTSQCCSQSQYSQAVINTMPVYTQVSSSVTAVYPRYPTPDVSKYQYDELSGYYYDQSTGLYYDANSHYYYNPVNQQFMYWDNERSTYIPVVNSSEKSETASVSSLNPDNTEQPSKAVISPRKEAKDQKDKKEKVKVAKKIAKEMEKWAETLNKQKEAIKKNQIITVTQPSSRQSRVQQAAVSVQESRTADAAFAAIAQKDDLLGLSLPVPAHPIGTAHTNLVAAYGGDSESDDEQNTNSTDVSEEKMIDWSKLACLLCKRQFDSKEILQKHIMISNLHKENLEKQRRTLHVDIKAQTQYRDRAKERREKYNFVESAAKKERLTENSPFVNRA